MKRHWKITLPSLIAITSLPFVGVVSCGNPHPSEKKMIIMLFDKKDLPKTLDIDSSITIDAFDENGDSIDNANFSSDSPNVVLSGDKNGTITGEIAGPTTITCKAPGYVDEKFDLLIKEPTLRTMIIKQSNKEAIPPILKINSTITIDAFDYITGVSVSNPEFTSSSDCILIDGNKIKGVSTGQAVIICEAPGYGKAFCSLHIYLEEYEYEYNQQYHTAILKKYNGVDEEVTIPSKLTYDNEEYTVTEIGNSAFNACQSLASVKIPYSVNAIGELAFADCEHLETVEFYSGDEIYPQLEWIYDGAFAFCISLKNIKLPDSVTFIGSNAFMLCISLRQLIIPKYLSYLGSRAFSYCLSLKIAKIPSTVYEIYERTFYKCSSLSTLELPDSLIYIGNEAVAECTSLYDGSYSNGIKYNGYSMQWVELSIKLHDVDWHRGTPALNIYCLKSSKIVPIDM